jgi:hypothetical protein
MMHQHCTQCAVPVTSVWLTVGKTKASQEALISARSRKKMMHQHCTYIWIRYIVYSTVHCAVPVTSVWLTIGKAEASQEALISAWQLERMLVRFRS